MKSAFISLAFLATIFAQSSVHAVPFHIIDSSFSTSAGPLVYGCHTESACDSDLVGEAYNLSSSKPVSGETEVMGNYLKSGASYSSVFIQQEWEPIIGYDDKAWFESSMGE